MYIHWIMKRPLSGVELEILESRISNLAPSYWHKNLDNRPCGRLYYIKKGIGYIRTFGREYKLVPGHLYLVPPGGDFAYGCRQDLQIWWLHFTARLYSCIDLFDYLPYEVEIVPGELKQVERRLLRLIEIHKSEGARNQLECNGLLLQFLASFFRDPDTEHLSRVQKARIRFLPVLRYIDEHLGEKLPVELLAKMACYEKSHFSTLFTAVIGSPPSKYVMRKRLEQAQLIMRKSDIKLDILARQLGFSDAFHFSKAFKRHTGHSPAEYRTMRQQGMP